MNLQSILLNAFLTAVKPLIKHAVDNKMTAGYISAQINDWVSKNITEISVYKYQKLGIELLKKQTIKTSTPIDDELVKLIEELCKISDDNINIGGGVRG